MSLKKQTPVLSILLLIMTVLGINAGIAFVKFDETRKGFELTNKIDEAKLLNDLEKFHAELRISILDFLTDPSPNHRLSIISNYKHQEEILSKINIRIEQFHLLLSGDKLSNYGGYYNEFEQIGLVLRNTDKLTEFAALTFHNQLLKFDSLVSKLNLDYQTAVILRHSQHQRILKKQYLYLSLSLSALGFYVLILFLYFFRQASRNNYITSQLENTQSTLSQTMDSMSEGYALFDENDRLVICNQVFCDMLKLENHPKGKSFYDLCLQSINNDIYKDKIVDKYQWIENRIEKRAQEKPVEFQLKDGTWIHASDRKTATGGTVGLRLDITDRIKAEEELRVALDVSQAGTKAKSEFLAIMSHEIRTPLNGVTGLLGLLLETKLDPEQRGYVLTAIESGELLLTVIEDVLDFSKIEAGKLILEDSEFNPAEIVQHVAELLAPRAHDKAIDIACFIDPSLPEFVRGDQARLRQILLNLAGNAVKFTNEGGVTIELTMVASDGDEITLSGSVTDTGIGIPYEKQDSLFDEFNQLDASYSRRFGGTGLGLAITRRLVIAMNGTISVNSVPDRGSSFSFSIQLHKTIDKAKNKAPIFKPAAIRTILFWAQKSSISHVVIQQIKADGHKVVVAETENDALQQLKTSLIDFVIINSRPRDTMGPVLAARLRARGNDIPILLLEPTGGLNNDASLLQDGTVTAILHKPTKLSNLRAFIDNPEHRVKDEIYMHNENDEYAKIGEGIRILLAEDSQTNRMVAVAILRRAGFRVDWVADGFEAVESVKRLPYDLVLMDVSMPKMDGLEATAAIRALSGDERDVPIIALTAHAMPGDEENFLSNGMNAYLTKPLHTKDMIAVITKYCTSNHKATSDRGLQNGNEFLTQDLDRKIETTTTLEINESYLSVPIRDDAIIAQLRIDAGGEALEGLLDIYLEEMKGRVESIKQSFIKNDLQAISKEAHALKSSSGSFGAIRMQNLASDIENLTSKRQIDGLEPLLENLASLAQETTEAYVKL